MTDMDRRAFVKVAGVTALAPAAAGCSGNGNGGGNGDGNGGSSDVPDELDEYLSDANEYDGTIADHTGEDEVTVDVGTGDNGFGFSTAAIRIDTGTTVVWEWTGEGGAHNVEDEDGEFESDLYSEEGETFEYTFEDSGNYRYFCNPHRSNGMLGGVAVE